MAKSHHAGILIAVLCSAAVCQALIAPSSNPPVTEPRTPPATRTAPDTTTTTSSAAPPNTTTSATTTPVPDTTTTPSPPDTTTATTTTAAPPTPLDPSIGHWSASDEATNRICVLLQMGVQMRIPYQTTQNMTKTADINIPKNASASGGCGEREYIRLSWPADDVDAQFSIAFEDNSTAGVYSVREIAARLPVSDQLFPDHASDLTEFSFRVNFSEVITVPQNASYRCISRQTFQLLSDDEADFSGELLLLHSQLQAYRGDNSTKFGAPLVCAADHHATSDVVPIAVGIALAVLVIVILIAYVIGRRRARQRGYQSV